MSDYLARNEIGLTSVQQTLKRTVFALLRSDAIAFTSMLVESRDDTDIRIVLEGLDIEVWLNHWGGDISTSRHNECAVRMFEFPSFKTPQELAEEFCRELGEMISTQRELVTRK